MRATKGNLDIAIISLRNLEDALAKTEINDIELQKLLLDTRCDLKHVALKVWETRKKALYTYFAKT